MQTLPTTAQGPFPRRKGLGQVPHALHSTT
jgi:hypothetical protein